MDTRIDLMICLDCVTLLPSTLCTNASAPHEARQRNDWIASLPPATTSQTHDTKRNETMNSSSRSEAWDTTGYGLAADQIVLGLTRLGRHISAIRLVQRILSPRTPTSRMGGGHGTTKRDIGQLDARLVLCACWSRWLVSVGIGLERRCGCVEEGMDDMRIGGRVIVFLDGWYGALITLEGRF
jgi:hypothetical protein